MLDGFDTCYSEIELVQTERSAYKSPIVIITYKGFYRLVLMGQSQSLNPQHGTVLEERELEGLPVHQPVASMTSGNIHVFDQTQSTVSFVPNPSYSAYNVTFTNEEKMKNVVVAVATRKK